MQYTSHNDEVSVLILGLNRNMERYHDRSLMEKVAQDASGGKYGFDKMVNNTNVAVVDLLRINLEFT